MKKTIIVSLIFATAAMQGFALPSATEITANKEQTAKVQAVLENKIAHVSEQKTAAQEKALTGTILTGSYTDGFLRIKNFNTKLFNVMFYIDNRTVNNTGNIAFAVTGTETVLKSIEVSTDTDFVEGVNGDPDTEINLSLLIKYAKTEGAAKETITIPAFTTVTLKDIKEGNFAESPKTVITDKKIIPTKVVIETEKQHKADCHDKYHCDCPVITKKVVEPMQLEEVKVHEKDCKDPYHCDCPTRQEYR